MTAPAFLLGKTIRLLPDENGELRAADGGQPEDPAAVERYLIKAFGARLAEVRTAMAMLAARYEAAELNRIGFRLYERFRPDVPPGNAGWAAKAVLEVDKILAATLVDRARGDSRSSILFALCSSGSLRPCTRRRSASPTASPTGLIAALSFTAARAQQSFRCACWPRSAATGPLQKSSPDYGASAASDRLRRSISARDIASTTMARRRDWAIELVPVPRGSNREDGPVAAMPEQTPAPAGDKPAGAATTTAGKASAT